MIANDLEKGVVIGVIYCYINKINGKKYIGQTIEESKRRYRFKTCKRYGGIKIDNARKKYGTSDNWEYKVLSKKQYLNEEDASFDLDLLETYYISKNQSYNNGYNSTYGADSVRGMIVSEETKQKIRLATMGENNPFYGKHHTEETKEKLRLANTGKHPSEEARKKMSEQRKGRKVSEETRKKISDVRKLRYPKGETHYNYGRKLTDEQRQKISISKIGKRRKDLEKIILQIDLFTGEVIKEWESIAKAAKTLNLHTPNIVNVCQGKYKQSGGFKWEYKESK